MGRKNGGKAGNGMAAESVRARRHERRLDPAIDVTEWTRASEERERGRDGGCKPMERTTPDVQGKADEVGADLRCCHMCER